MNIAGLIDNTCLVNESNFVIFFFLFMIFTVIEDNEIVYRDYVDISVAVATPKVQNVCSQSLVYRRQNEIISYNNRPFPSCPKLLFQSEAKGLFIWTWGTPDR